MKFSFNFWPFKGQNIVSSYFLNLLTGMKTWRTLKFTTHEYLNIMERLSKNFHLNSLLTSFLWGSNDVAHLFFTNMSLAAPVSYTPVSYIKTCNIFCCESMSSYSLVQSVFRIYILKTVGLIWGRSFFSLHTWPGEVMFNSQNCFIAPIKKIKNVSEPQSRKSKMFHAPPSLSQKSWNVSCSLMCMTPMHELLEPFL